MEVKVGKKKRPKTTKLKLVVKNVECGGTTLVNPGLGGRWKNAADPIDRMTNCGRMLVNTGSGGGWENAAYLSYGQNNQPVGASFTLAPDGYQ